MAPSHIKTPNVSIGLPVRNGEEYLRTAIDSLLAQDYRDFELIISDNASTDGTSRICQEYARSDPRIRFHQIDANVGAAENFNRTFRLSSGTYFMWAAHDDRWHPSYISRCIAALERSPAAVLCASSIRFIDESGVEIDVASLGPLIGEYNRLHTVSLGLVERVRELTKTINWYTLYGLIRADALRQTSLIRDAYGADVLLLMELLLLGETIILADALFDYRLVRKAPERQMEDLSGISSRAEEVKAYTLTAKGLLDAIDECALSSDNKTILREDLLENVSFANQRWADRIAWENEPIIVDHDRYLASFQIRDLLTGMPVRAPETLRGPAYRKSASSLSGARRLQQEIHRVLDRHVMWRFRSKQ